MNESTRYGVYLAISSLGFVTILIPALIRFAAQMTRPRFAIVLFALSWAVISAQSSAIRFGLSGDVVLAIGPVSEATRIACAVSTFGVAYEYVIGRIFTRSARNRE